MLLSSEMEKNSTEDDCVDSGAETGGSDYSPMSSASSELSMVELQDPFLVSVHLITDPGQAKSLQHAADTVLAWVHPELQLFRVSERAAWQQKPKRQSCHASASFSANHGPPQCQPALAVILFLQEQYGGEEQIVTLHRALRRPPWHFHHTERVNNGRRMLPLTPCSQDFFTLAPGTPLWAVRQVHYGKEIVRFTVYCRYESFRDMVRMYRMILQRKLAQKKEDFCFFVVYSNPDTEIQLSFKRLPRGQSPAPTESAVIEMRVRDVGALVPLLPYPCTPISEVRWQTEDYDGNKILLQVLCARYKRRHTIDQPGDSSPAPSPLPTDPAMTLPSAGTYGRGPASYRNRRYHRNSSRSRTQTLPLPQTQNQTQSRSSQTSQTSRSLACEEEEMEMGARSKSWRTGRTRSLFSLPSLAGFTGSRSRSAGSSPGTSPSPAHHRSHSHSLSSSLVPPFRLNVDALIGAEETDVDTGIKVDAGSIVDLSVVSAYSRSRRPTPPRPLSAPPRDPTPSPSHANVKPKASTLGRPPVPMRTSSLASSNSIPSTLQRPRPNSAFLPLSGQPSLRDPITCSQLDSSNSIIGVVSQNRSGKEVGVEDDDQEFYI
ncbi:protein FAM124A [Salvelinus alpinus]|uniref:protein FAM124A n=2 Tax=Salvelinus TaxID=8033 RepID=UPI0039FC3427